MKLKYSIEINPAVAVLLILLALIGIDLAWTRQRKTKRSAAQPMARPAAQPAEPPARPPSPFGSRKPSTPTREPITHAQGQVIIERDATKRPRANRARLSPEEREEQRKQWRKESNLRVGQAAQEGFDRAINQLRRQPTEEMIYEQ